ncbi:MAG: sulfite exporter TauE/SafE family protein [Thermoplasmatales archaeon]
MQVPVSSEAEMLSFSFFEYFLIMLLVAFGAGCLGALVGIGGGVVISPFVTLFGVPPVYAIGASLIGVITTSCGAGITSFNRGSPANYRIGTLLLTTITSGAIIGTLTTITLSRMHIDWILYLAFGLVLIFCSIDLIRGGIAKEPVSIPTVGGLSKKLRLSSKYIDPTQKKEIEYHPSRITEGMTAMFGAGIISGMLGVGGGVFNSLAMNSVMKIPFKVSAATSNFMLGITAATSVGILFSSGFIFPPIVAPVIMGILPGSIVGRSLLNKVKTPIAKFVLILVLLSVSVEMLIKGGLITWLT